MQTTVGRPAADEFAPYYATYIDKTTGDDPIAALAQQTTDSETVFRGLDDARGLHRYAPGKWSIKEVVGHITDAERVFAFRALWFARADVNGLPGFDENAWVPAAGFDALPMQKIVAAWRAQREATLTLLRSFGPDAWTRRGTANGKEISVRSLAFILSGHEKHHVGVLRERYGI